jgi:peptide/nickel transport system permease protein
MENSGKKYFTESLTILCLIMLPLICLPIRLVPDVNFRCILFAIISSCCIGFFLFETLEGAGFSKIVGAFFLLPIILSASLIIVLPEKITAATEVLSFEKNLLPNGTHLLGTDYKGRDVLFSLIGGGGNTYFIAIIATMLSSFFGVVIGILMTVEQKLFQTTAKLFTELFEILPWVFFLIIVTGVFFVWINEQNYTPPTAFKVLIIGILIGLTSIPYTARLVQRIVEQNYQSPYVLTLKASAVSRSKVLLYNVLWKKVMPQLIVQISFIFGLIILVESSLEYILSIGFGEYGKAGYLSWGRILADARHSAIFGEKLWIIVPPILCITLSILGSNMIGDSLSKSLSQRLKN